MVETEAGGQASQKFKSRKLNSESDHGLVVSLYRIALFICIIIMKGVMTTALGGQCIQRGSWVCVRVCVLSGRTCHYDTDRLFLVGRVNVSTPPS